LNIQEVPQLPPLEIAHPESKKLNNLEFAPYIARIMEN